MHSPQQDDLRELAGIFYGIVAAVVLIVSVVQLIESAHHTVGYWLVAASWLITFAALAWGFHRHGPGVDGDGDGPHIHPPPLAPGHEEVSEDPLGNISRRAVKQIEEKS
jgi:hypothetical protein